MKKRFTRSSSPRSCSRPRAAPTRSAVLPPGHHGDPSIGLELSVQGGTTEEGDGEDLRLSALAGGQLFDGRGHAVVGFNYIDSRKVRSRDRSISKLDAFRSASAGFIQPNFSSFVPAGRFDVGNGFANEFTFNEAGEPVLVSEQQATGDFGFNRNEFRLIQVPTERFILNALTSYDLTDQITWFFEGSYANTESASQTEPQASSNSTTVGTLGPVLQIPVTNPFMPDAVRAAATANDLDAITFARRNSEFGLRESDVDRDTFRLVTGLRGDLTERIQYEAYYLYGKADSSQIDRGAFNTLLMQQGLNAEAVLDDLGDPTGAVQCADPLARAIGCVPANLFGAGAISDAARDFVATTATFDFTVKQEVAAVGLTGSLLTLPAGDLGFAAGFEYRDESSRFRPDPATQSGFTSGTQTSALAGLTLALDYYQIEVEDAIQGFDRQTIVNQCVDQPDFPDNPFCGLITRNPTDGNILAIDNQQQNVAKQTVEGLDYSGSYRYPIGQLIGPDEGSLQFSVVGSVLFENTSRPFNGAEKDVNDGEVRFPEHRFNLRSSYLLGDFEASWRLRYVGSAKITNDSDIVDNNVGDQFYNDLTFRHRLQGLAGLGSVNLTAGINNLLDNKPPKIGAPFASNVTGCETACDVYDILGRAYFLTVGVTL